MKFFLLLFRFFINLLYLPMKLFKVKHKVVFLSRQSNSPTLDFKMIADEIKIRDNELEIVFLCKRFDNIKKHLLSYSVYTIKTLYHIATSKVCIVDSYSVLSMLKNRKKLKVLQIWHALGAIKKFGYQTVGKEAGRSENVAKELKMHVNYTNIITSSKESQKFFEEAFGYSSDKFLNYGLPRIDYLLKEENNLKQKALSKYPNLKDKEVILYAPTFRKNKESKTDDLIESLNLDKYNLIVKGHLNQELEFNKNAVYTCDDISAFDLIPICDYLITDYSAIAIEAAVLNKKTYYYVYDYEEYKEENGLNVDLYKEMDGCVFKSASELCKTLEENNYDENLIKNYQKKYIDNLDGNATIKIVNLIMNWVEIYENKN